MLTEDVSCINSSLETEFDEDLGLEYSGSIEKIAKKLGYNIEIEDGNDFPEIKKDPYGLNRYNMMHDLV